MSDVVKPPIHGRDHRAGGSDPIPGVGTPDPYISRIMTSGTALSVASLGTSTVVFDQDDMTQAAGYFDTTSTTTARIKAQGSGSQGIYRFTAAAKWDTPFDANSMLILACPDMGWFPAISWREIFSGASPIRGDLVPVLDLTARISTTVSSNVQLLVSNGAGTSQNLAQATLDIFYLGKWAGSADDTFLFA